VVYRHVFLASRVFDAEFMTRRAEGRTITSKIVMKDVARWLILAALLASCSGDGTNASTSGADAGVSLDALRAAFCKTVRACCAAAGSPPEPLASCELAFDRQISFIGLAAKGTVLVDEAKLRTCVTRIDEQSRTCKPPEDVCVEAFSPTLDDGAPCERAEECKGTDGGPVACVKPGATADSGGPAGVCRSVPIGKSGETCYRSCTTRRDCSLTASGVEIDLLTVCREGDGLYGDSTGHCAPIRADGAPCVRGGCASTSFCSAVCTPRKAQGSACASSAECRDGFGCVMGSCATVPFATADLCRGDFN
jgi:hypothetical protein